MKRDRQRVLRSKPVVDGDGDDVGVGDQTGEESGGGGAEGGAEAEGAEVFGLCFCDSNPETYRWPRIF